MKFKIKGPKIKIGKKTMQALTKGGMGAISGFAMGGPFGAAGGALSAIQQKGKPGGQTMIAGLATGALMGAATGEGLVGKVISPKAQELYAKGKKAVKNLKGAFKTSSSGVTEKGSFTEKTTEFLGSVFGGDATGGSNAALAEASMFPGMGGIGGGDPKKMIMAAVIVLGFLFAVSRFAR